MKFTNEEIKEVLVKARDLIKNVGWTQGTHARNKNGDKIVTQYDLTLFPNANRNRFEDEVPVCYCINGAIQSSVPLDDIHRAYRLWGETLDFLTKITGMHIIDLNDHPKRTKEEVIEAFDKAIAFLN